MLAADTGHASSCYGAYADGYEHGILVAAVPVFVWPDWTWRPVRVLMIDIVMLPLSDISQYADTNGPSLARTGHTFFLKYLLVNQSAVLRVNVLVSLSILLSWTGLPLR